MPTDLVPTSVLCIPKYIFAILGQVRPISEPNCNIHHTKFLFIDEMSMIDIVCWETIEEVVQTLETIRGPVHMLLFGPSLTSKFVCLAKARCTFLNLYESEGLVLALGPEFASRISAVYETDQNVLGARAWRPSAFVVAKRPIRLGFLRRVLLQSFPFYSIRS